MRLSDLFCRARLVSLALLTGVIAMLAFAAPATAAMLLVPSDFTVPDAGTALALDGLGHDLLLNAAPPNSPAFMAFVAEANQHQLFIGGGFVLGDAPLLN